MSMKKFILMLLIFFLCGIISADLCMEDLRYSEVFLDEDVYRGYANANLVFKDVFWNIVYERIKLIMMLCLLCFTPIKGNISFVLVSVFSFLWGFYFMSCIIALGMVGVVVGITSVFPHGLFYAGGLLFVLKQSNTYSFHHGKKLTSGVITWLFSGLMFLVGCVIESLMGTHFIPWIIRIGML